MLWDRVEMVMLLALGAAANTSEALLPCLPHGLFPNRPLTGIGPQPGQVGTPTLLLSAKLPKEAVWTYCLILPHQLAHTHLNPGKWPLCSPISSSLTSQLQPQLILTVSLSKSAKDVPSSKETQSLPSRRISFAKHLPPAKHSNPAKSPSSIFTFPDLSGTISYKLPILILKLSCLFFFSL